MRGARLLLLLLPMLLLQLMLLQGHGPLPSTPTLPSMVHYRADAI